MTAFVHNRPPCTMTGSLAPTGIQIGKPVVGAQWTAGAYLANYLQGHGGTLIAANTPGSRSHAVGSSTNYRYYIWPRYTTRMRLWVVTLIANDEDAASGKFNVDGAEIGIWAIPADSATIRLPHTFYFFETVTRSASPTSLYVTLVIDSNAETTVSIQQIACYAVPRHYLVQDSNEVGSDVDSVRAGNIIYSDADGDSPAVYKSVSGVRYGSYQATEDCRRDGHYHWFDPDGVTAATASYADLFPVYPEALGRKLWAADGAGQTQGRTLEWAVYGTTSGAEEVADAVKVTTISGNTATLTIGSATTWYGPTTIAVDCEDLTDAKGLRDSTWETLQYEFKKGENALVIYGISVGEQTQ